MLGGLEPDAAAAFGLHLAECAVCAADVAQLQDLPVELAHAAPRVLLPPELEARTLGAVRRAALRARLRRGLLRALTLLLLGLLAMAAVGAFA